MPMPIDFNKLDKPKIIVLALALASAVAATVLMNIYIGHSIEEGAGSKQAQFLLAKVQELEEANKALNQKQAAYASRIQQELDNLVKSQKAQVVQQPTTEKPEVKKQSLAIKTPAGKRAVTVNITTLSAVGGLLNPGDVVDVLVHLSIPSVDNVAVEKKDGSKEKETTKTTITLFQGIQILAIGSNVNEPADFDGQQKSSNLIITLAVDPQQAELIAFAESYGKLQLVLRGPGERAAYQLPSANWETFTQYLEATQGVMIEPPVSLRKPEAPKKNLPSPEPEIKVYRGGQ